jgi:hypothetical protein
MVRSILAIVAGIAVLTAASFALEALVKPLMGEGMSGRSLPQSLFQLAYTAASIAAGGYATAWVARRLEVRHAVIMGAIEVVLTIMAMQAFPGKAPLWFWIATMIITVPAAWLGGKIKQPAARPG